MIIAVCRFLSNVNKSSVNLLNILNSSVYVPTNSTTKNSTDVWLTVHRNSVWIRKTN